ncbi:hypothetical protein A2U01_0079825, partial [Trifolium medium]|nr:hypothetical protein [Trifolium medium]
MATLRRMERTSTWQISWPSRKSEEEGGSQRRFNALKRVDFLLPLGHMIPTITPFGMSNVISF